MPMRRSVKDLAFAPAAGTGATNIDIAAVDISRARAVVLELILTGNGAAEAGDTLDVYFQEASESINPTWDDRAHFPQLLGNMTVSAAAPEKRRLQVPCDGFDEAVGERSYEGSGSAGAAHIAAGTVIGGPMLGRRGNSTAGRVARHRFRLEVTDANSNSAFVGVLNVWVDAPF